MLAILLLVGIFSVTYAYLNARVTLEKSNIVTAGILKVDLKEDTPITLSSAYPITEEAGLGSEAFTFELKNTGNLNTSYTIYLDDIENNSIPSQYLRYSLLKDGKYTTNGTSALFSSLSPSPNRILDVGSIFAGVTYQYELRIWIDLNAPNSIQGKSWQGRLRVEQEASEETVLR